MAIPTPDSTVGVGSGEEYGSGQANPIELPEAAYGCAPHRPPWAPYQLSSIETDGFPKEDITMFLILSDDEL